MRLILIAPIDDHSRALSRSLRLRDHEVIHVLHAERATSLRADMYLLDDVLAGSWDFAGLVRELAPGHPQARFVLMGECPAFDACEEILGVERCDRRPKPISPYELVHLAERPLESARPVDESKTSEDARLEERARSLASFLGEIDSLDARVTQRIVSLLAAGDASAALDAAPSLAELLRGVLGRDSDRRAERR